MISSGSSEFSTEYLVTNSLDMDELERLKFFEFLWKIEEYHRGIKQFCGIEFSQVRSAKAQRNHIGLAIRTFLRFAVYCFKISHIWFEAKYSIIRDAVINYMQHPEYVLGLTA